MSIWGLAALIGALSAPLDAAHAQPAFTDMSVFATDSPDPVSPDGNITYTVTLTNHGPIGAPSTLQIQNSGSLRFVSLTAPAGWSCATPPVGSTPTMNCSHLSLPAGSTEIFTLVAQADGALIGPSDTTVQMSFNVVAGITDSLPGNDSDTVVTSYVTPQADMAVTLSGPASADVSDPVTYTITATNNGPDDAVAVDVTAAGQPGMTFVSLSPPGGWSCMTPAVGVEGLVDCTVATMASGATATFTMVYTAPSSGATADAQATVLAALADPNPANNISQVSTALNSTPAAPTVANLSGVAVPYNSGGTAIDLAPSVTGTYSSVALASAPAHGTTSTAGAVVTYTPTSGYFGADSFTYTATGPGGTSSPATVGLTVATPAAPTVADRSGIAVNYNSSGTAIDVASVITGVYSSVAVASPPSHGSVSVAGSVITYTPTSGYFGADSFTYTATGPGGTSSPATVSLTIATPAAPTVADRSGIAVNYNSSGTAIDLASAITGVYSSVAVASGPSHGALSVSGAVITYTPTSGYSGVDSFTYTATGPGGTSSPATVSLTVATPAAPTAADRSGIAVNYNSSGTAIDLAGSITGVYSSIAVASAPSHGITSVTGAVVTYTPTDGYSGSDSFTYTATGPGGTSAAATVSLTVGLPPAPVASDASVDIPYGYENGSAGYFIDAPVSGVYTSLNVVSDAAHGGVTPRADKFTYLMLAGFYGTDSFTYTATGPGGTSAPATVTITVATPGAPTVADVDADIPYNSTGTDFELQVSGVSLSMAVGTPPAHGIVSVSGTTATYTPTSGYSGADSFTYTATGPGGTSSPATVTLNVAVPAGPSASDLTGVAVPYNSGGAAIDLDSSISGVYLSVSVASPPANGSTSVSGAVVTYTPTSGYYGPDSFTYTATGPGGVSEPATVTITVANPAAPTVADIAADVPFGSAGTSIDLPVSGVAFSQAIATAPTHGLVTLDGTAAIYFPGEGYTGPDSFTYTATGPGGTSSPATVTVTVQPPGPPTVAPIDLTAPFAIGGTVSIDLEDYVTGYFTSIEPTSEPEHGALTVAMTPPTATAIYTMDEDSGPVETFTFRVTGANGERVPGTVTIHITDGATIPSLQETAAEGQTTTVDVTALAVAAGIPGPFTSGAFVSGSSSKAEYGMTCSDETDVPGCKLSVRPLAGAEDTISVNYTLTNRFGTKAGVVQFVVQHRPTSVTVTVVTTFAVAASSAALDAYRETLQESIARAADVSTSRVEVTDVTSSLRFNGPPDLPEPNLEGPFPGINARLAAEHTRDDWFLTTPAQSIGGSEPPPTADAPPPGVASQGPLSVWVGGSVTFGRRKSGSGDLDLDILSSGLVAGVDFKPSENSALGVSLGYSRSITDIGSEGSRIEGAAWVGTIYGGYRPIEGLYVSGAVGGGRLDLDLDRELELSDGVATGKRDAHMVFGGLESGFERTGPKGSLSSYGRFEFSQSRFDAYTESGGGLENLSYADMDASSLLVALGARGEVVNELRSGIVRPRAMIEILHEFQDINDQAFQWADWLDGPTYLAPGQSRDHTRIRLGVGNSAVLKNGWSLDFDARAEVGSDQALGTFRLKAEKKF